MTAERLFGCCHKNTGYNRRIHPDAGPAGTPAGPCSRTKPMPVRRPQFAIDFRTILAPLWLHGFKQCKKSLQKIAADFTGGRYRAKGCPQHP